MLRMRLESMEVLSVTRLVIPRNGQAELIFTGNLQENPDSKWESYMVSCSFSLTPISWNKGCYCFGLLHQDWLIWIHLVTNNSWSNRWSTSADNQDRQVSTDISRGLRSCTGFSHLCTLVASRFPGDHCLSRIVDVRRFRCCYRFGG